MDIDIIDASTHLVNRRRLLKGAAAGGAGLLGLQLLPGVLHAEARSPITQPGRSTALHDAMRKLWEDHIVWTRLFIVSFVAGLPDLEPTTQRLLRNQVDIGAAIVPFYGQDAGDQLTALLTDHILGAAKLLAAAKAGDTAGVDQASAEWYANADQIAAFLAAANPRAWPFDEMQSMMHEHLDLTLAEAVAQLQGDWAGSIAAYDRVHDEILLMADMLSAGLTGRGHR
jgi:hypothetical protein